MNKEEFFCLAAKVFGVSREKLSPTLKYGEIPEWDSVNHLRLVMETEKVFGVKYPLEKIPFLSSLADFLV